MPLPITVCCSVVAGGVVPVGAGGAMTPPDFGRSVNSISTRGTDYAHLITRYWHPRIFRPADDPEICMAEGRSKTH